MNFSPVLLNFRDALASVVPFVERVDIPWKRPDAYDNWDAIASVLFDKLVVEVIKWSLEAEKQETFSLPAYDLLLDDYSGLSTLEVRHPALTSERWIFHAFGTERRPLDVVELRKLDDRGLPCSERLKTCPIESSRFLLRIFRPSGQSLVLEELPEP
ncbi:MAG: hypothetical protein AAF772_04990 [Acidobacteriota bacterium]